MSFLRHNISLLKEEQNYLQIVVACGKHPAPPAVIQNKLLEIKIVRKFWEKGHNKGLKIQLYIRLYTEL